MRKTTPQWGKIAVATALIAGGITLANAHETDDDDHGEKIVKTYDLSGFDAIKVSGVYDMDVKVGESFSIRLEGPEREMERARVEVEGDMLVLGQSKKKSRWKKRKSVNAYITMPDLNALKVSGVTDADINGVDTDTFDLRVSGVADVDISGRCDLLDARISGVSDVDAQDLKCARGDVTLSGVGDMEVYTSDAIDASVSGVGDVTVYGSPEKVEKSVSKYTASLTIK